MWLCTRRLCVCVHYKQVRLYLCGRAHTHKRQSTNTKTNTRYVLMKMDPQRTQLCIHTHVGMHMQRVCAP